MTQEATQEFNTGAPGLKLALGDMISDLGAPGSEPASVKNAFASIRSTQEGQFDQAAASAPGSVQQVAKSTGYRGEKGAVDSQISDTLYGLESRRRAASRSLQEQESDAALQQRDFEISSILGLGTGGVQQSFGLTSNAIQAAAQNTSNPWGGAASGAAAGAALGTEIYPGIGTAVGAVGGGVLGYFGGR